MRHGRYSYKVFERDTTPHWIAVFGLQWQILECHRLEPDTDLSGAMAAAIERLAGKGWEAECEPRFGFTFIQRDSERRLLILTPRDPYDTQPTSFNPFR
jgi:hypothetical protein